MNAEQRGAIKKLLFAVQIRRHGIFTCNQLGEQPPEEIENIFAAESVLEMKSKADKIAKDLRQAINQIAAVRLRELSDDKVDFQLLVELQYPIPIEFLIPQRRTL